MSDSGHTLDINATFRGGGRSIEWLDEINKASIVMLAETDIVPRDVAGRIRVISVARIPQGFK